MRFTNEVAVITGAGSGIGRGAAVRLAGEGASLLLCGRNAAPLDETRKLCAGREGRVLCASVDVRDPKTLGEAFARAQHHLGPITIAIASHGVNVIAPVESMELETWNEIISINLTGAFLVAREAARRMRKSGRGRIILVSSVSGRPGHTKFPGFAAYCASKYGLTGLTEVLAAEIEGSDIGVAAICPAGVDTAMFRGTFPGAEAPLGLDTVSSAIADLADPACAPPRGVILDLG